MTYEVKAGELRSDVLGFMTPEEDLKCLSLVMKVINVLHVAKDDMLLAGDAWRDLLHAVGHLPQVRLTHTQAHSDSCLFGLRAFQRVSFSPPDTPGGL